MPCWTTQVQKVQLEIAAKNPVQLRAALEILGPGTVQDLGNGAYSVTIDGVSVTIRNGQATVEKGNEAVVEKIKAQYGIEAAKKVAKQAGWGFKQTSQTKFQFVKRSL